MPGIEDTLVVTFPITWSHAKIGKYTSRWQHMIRGARLNDAVNELRITILLDRPDTLDKGEITRYQSEAQNFRDFMATMCTSAKLHIADFNIPSPQSP